MFMNDSLGGKHPHCQVHVNDRGKEFDAVCLINFFFFFFYQLMKLLVLYMSSVINLAQVRFLANISDFERY